MVAKKLRASSSGFCPVSSILTLGWLGFLLQKPCPKLSVYYLMIVAEYGHILKSAGADLRLEIRVGGEAHIVTRTLQSQRKCQVGLHVSPAAHGKNRNAQGISSFGVSMPGAHEIAVVRRFPARTDKPVDASLIGVITGLPYDAQGQ